MQLLETTQVNSVVELAGCYYGSSGDNEVYDTNRGLTYKEMMGRDVCRFAAADLDGDKQLTRDELADFLHPCWFQLPLSRFSFPPQRMHHTCKK